MKRKAVQKSHDASSRRSAAKPAKSREEQSVTDSPAPLAFHVDIPKGLKDVLVKSRTQIKQREKLLILPRDYSVEKHAAFISEKPLSVKETLEQFTEYFLDKANEKSLRQSVEDSSIIPVITRGLMVYFEKTLATNVLYYEERGQYAFLDNHYRSGTTAVVESIEEQPMCNWYGPDHLLRLLVILPEILSKSSLDGYSADLVGIYVQYLLSWMDDNKARLFLTPSQYIDTPPHYTTDVRRRNHGGGGGGKNEK